MGAVTDCTPRARDEFDVGGFNKALADANDRTRGGLLRVRARGRPALHPGEPPNARAIDPDRGLLLRISRKPQRAAIVAPIACDRRFGPHGEYQRADGEDMPQEARSNSLSVSGVF